MNRVAHKDCNKMLKPCYEEFSIAAMSHVVFKQIFCTIQYYTSVSSVAAIIMVAAQPVRK